MKSIGLPAQCLPLWPRQEKHVAALLTDFAQLSKQSAPRSIAQMIMPEDNPGLARQTPDGREKFVPETFVGHQPYLRPMGFFIRGLATLHLAAYSFDA
jgi:hypothetical protein